MTDGPISRSPRRLCEAIVIMAERDTRAKVHRIEQAHRRGHPPEQCGNTADFVVDGKPLCRSHAGQAALRILFP